MLGFSSSSGSAFSLKVWVTDALSRRRIGRAAVDVYINCTRTYTVVTGDDGGVLINITDQTVAPVTVVVSKDGYLPKVLPYKAKRLPSKVLNASAYVAMLILQTSHILPDFSAAVFSSVTISLLALNQGNIWLYEDSVLISGRSSGIASFVFFFSLF